MHCCVKQHLSFAAASSKQKSTSSSQSGSSGKESTRKSSSLSAATTSKSSRKTSSDLKNLKDNDSEGNSFWTSFLGDSVSSNTSKSESKTSSHRTSGRKLGSRLSGGNVGGSDDKNEPDSVNTSKGNENTASARSLKQHKKHDINLTDSAKSESNLLISQQDSTTNGSKDVANQNTTDSVNSQENACPEKAEYNTQELSVVPVETERENRAKSERLKLSSSGESHKGNLKEKRKLPGDDVFKVGNDASMQDVSAVKNSDVSKEKKANADYKEPGSLLESQSPDTDSSYSAKKSEQFEELHKTANNTLDSSHLHKLSSQDIGDRSSIIANESMSSDLDGPSLVDPTNNAVITDKSGYEIQQESAGQNKFLDVEPLASSTPNPCVKEQSISLDKTAVKTKLTPAQPTDENKEDLNQNGDLLVYAVHGSEIATTGIKENITISENVAEMFMEAASIVEDKESPKSIPKQEINESDSDVTNAVNRLPLQQTSTNVFGES